MSAATLAAWHVAAGGFEIGDTGYETTTLSLGAGETVMCAGDFNTDGHTDVVVAVADQGEAVLLRGDGRGGLHASARVEVGPNPTDIIAIDIDADGHLDLAVANHETTTVSLLQGDGRGGFTHGFGSPLTVDVDPHPHAVRLHDLDRDGVLDIVVDDRNRNGVRVYYGLQKGVFSADGRHVSLGGDPYLGLAVADIDDNGYLDLLTPNTHAIGIALGGDEGFQAQPGLEASSPFALSVADFTADGHLDLLIANESGGPGLELLAGDGRGEFRHRARLRLPPGGKRIVTGEIDGRPGADFLALSWGGAVIAGLGGAQLGAVDLPLGDVSTPWGALIADLNDDGRGDLLVADGQRALVNVYLSFALPMERDAR